MIAIIGIDPGFSGAIAIYWPDTHRLEVHDMPVVADAKGRVMLAHGSVLDLLAEDGAKAVWLEQVGTMPGQGISSAFRFGATYGAIQMAVAARCLPLRLVTPNVWKKAFGLTADKNASRGLAMQRFPDAADRFSRKQDDGRAEAALIALYGATHV
jgi:crossover junction endodeoxyribonuclease RuvC